MTIIPITKADLYGSGLRIDTNLPDSVVANAINEGALFHAKGMLGDEHFITACSFTGPLMDGGTYCDAEGKSHYVAGFKAALIYFAYVSLLRHNIVATTFGSVQKRDEYSDNVNPGEQIKYYETIARQYIRDIAECQGWKINLGGYFTTTATTGRGGK